MQDEDEKYERAMRNGDKRIDNLTKRELYAGLAMAALIVKLDLDSGEINNQTIIATADTLAKDLLAFLNNAVR